MTNFGLKDDIKAYWSKRAETFDQSVGHRIQDEVEASAWQQLLSEALGPLAGKHVLDLACGTGEISRMALALGAQVTGVDFAEPMLERAAAKNSGPAYRTRIADVESLVQEGSDSYDALVTRHLVWTLVDPLAAFAEWRRVLKPGGRLLIVDGDFVNTPIWGRLFRDLVRRVSPVDRHRGADPETHNRILSQVHYRDGLTAARLRADLESAGFHDVRAHAVRRIYLFGMSNSALSDRLRLLAMPRFALSAAR